MVCKDTEEDIEEIMEEMHKALEDLNYEYIEKLANDWFFRPKVFKAAVTMNKLNVIQHLHKAGYDDEYLLCDVCWNGNYEIAMYLIHERKVNVQMCSNAPLRFAVTHENIMLVRLLLDMGANVHALEDSAILNATASGYLHHVKMLHEYGADICAQNNAILITAAYNGFSHIVQYLIDNDVDIHVKNEHALISAASNGKYEVVEMLLKAGADVHAKNDTAIFLATCAPNNALETVKVLVKYGATYKNQSNLILKSSMDQQNIELVEYLLSIGATNDALDEAIFMQHEVMIRTIFKYPKVIITETCQRILQQCDDYAILLLLCDLGVDFSLFHAKQQKGILILQNIRKRFQTKAANRIAKWWIPFCYDPASERGKRMAERSWERVKGWYENKEYFV